MGTDWLFTRRRIDKLELPAKGHSHYSRAARFVALSPLAIRPLQGHLEWLRRMEGRHLQLASCARGEADRTGRR